MAVPDYDVSIVGAGFSGLYILYRCGQLGLDARVWEKGASVGGTWYWNRYPGARCDIESVQYSYQFDDALQQDWIWSERYASQPEILAYIEHVADRFGLYESIDFLHETCGASYGDESRTWTLSAASGEAITSRYCVMATGCLSCPNWPKIPGLDAFEGEVFHTALWPHDGVDFADKRVAVIGTGSSGIQSIPRIAEHADHLTVFQRTPNYSVPAHNRRISKSELAMVKANYPEIRARARQTPSGIDGDYNPGSAMDVPDTERQAEYERRWQRGGLPFMHAYGDYLSSTVANENVAEFVRNKIRQKVPDSGIADILCPTGAIGAKRLCVDIDYFETFNRSNVDLVDIRATPIKRIDSHGLWFGSVHVAVDVIVVATGFDAMTGALNAIDVRGRDGVSLRDRWRNGPRTYLGVAMAGFPNLFTVTGPGSPSVLTNMIPTLEQNVEWITDLIAHAAREEVTEIEATEEAERAWWRHVQDVGFQGLKAATDSWYVGANIEGKPRTFLPYNGGFPEYCEKCEQVAENDYEGFILTCSDRS